MLLNEVTDVDIKLWLFHTHSCDRHVVFNSFFFSLRHIFMSEQNCLAFGRQHFHLQEINHLCFHLNVFYFVRDDLIGKQIYQLGGEWRQASSWTKFATIIDVCVTWTQIVNTLRPKQNGRHFADGIFKCIFLNENAWISLKISLKFVP